MILGQDPPGDIGPHRPVFVTNEEYEESTKFVNRATEEKNSMSLNALQHISAVELK